MPAMEKLASNMRDIGIKVGAVDVGICPALAATYQTYTIPQFILFRPNKDPLLYTRDRTAKAMGKYILKHQVGKKQVALLEDNKSIDKFFNVTSKIPRILLLSSKPTVPPIFKEACFKQRKGLKCGFVGKNFNSLESVSERLNKIGNFNLSEVKYPSLLAISEVENSNEHFQHRIESFKGDISFDDVFKFMQSHSNEMQWKIEEGNKEKDEKKLLTNEQTNATTAGIDGVKNDL
ncbi:uncharacterized protein MONOS_10559 [Monocercomonoides exilis]|uniref:uncharacterized protein n=1 Tax=Monocercomonoides exilis TaxID=2049356 RepID=UPI00355AAEDA|nr:hypothetical protein MONOS_10559 [Monocercomonoides exilis]|eukprot:MONOS_10559.1-p1 / transcript=MONOS_10559.1 / gene=MONOS_10559 / organism=Monocercomonoides_exilis_PA203 / gene_product=unspecified product / transcript_product=unspecified product / location=Mono_scaffold00485:12351-13052(-) / protein_length=234 / sequence_SO=supercontig / SO=protein_coding / is_pseudo=false